MSDLPAGVTIDVRPIGGTICVRLDVEGTTFELRHRDASLIGYALVEASHKAEDENRRAARASEVRAR